MNADIIKFICLCLSLDEFPESRETIRLNLTSGIIDLDKFIHLVSNHYVLPAVYLKLKAAKLLDVFPPEYSKHLKEICTLNKKRNTEILSQIDEISQELSKERIKPIYLKGTANLMDGLYADLGERMIGDIDFLVQEKDYLKTAEIVLSMDYENEFTAYESVQTFKHFPRLFRKDVPADVEIHRIPVRSQYTKQFSTELLFQDKVRIKDIKNCFVSANENKLIHTFIHSQLSNKGHQRFTIGLRDLYDAYLLFKKVDVEQVLSQTEEKAKARIFFDYVNYLFPQSQDLKQITNKASLTFIKQHQWFLNHPRSHRSFLKLLDFYELIIFRYFWRILSAPFQKSSFNYLYNRLKDLEWYKMHFRELFRTFYK